MSRIILITKLIGAGQASDVAAGGSAQGDGNLLNISMMFLLNEPNLKCHQYQSRK